MFYQMTLINQSLMRRRTWPNSWLWWFLLNSGCLRCFSSLNLQWHWAAFSLAPIYPWCSWRSAKMLLAHSYRRGPTSPRSPSSETWQAPRPMTFKSSFRLLCRTWSPRACVRCPGSRAGQFKLASCLCCRRIVRTCYRKLGRFPRRLYSKIGWLF